MESVLAIVAIIFLLLCISELLWRYRSVHPEYTRKFVHITVGSFVAFWPLFLSRQEIVGLSVAFLIVVGVAHYLNIFRAIRSVQRPTWGEAFFAIAVGVLAYIAPNGWIYMAALLHMSVADGLAAVIGTHFGKRTSYHVFGFAKSVVGTLTFFVVSAAIVTGYALFNHTGFNPLIIAIVFGSTFLENIAVRGLDNLFVPVFVAASLNFLH